MKTSNRHGISIGIERIDCKFFLFFKAVGRLTHDDYEQIVPLIDFALHGVKDPQVRALVDARDFEGWELRAAWDDFKLALKYGNEFSRIAVLGDEKWQEVASRIVSWFTSGEVQYFEEQDEALEWLAKPLPEKSATPANRDCWEKPIFPSH